MPKPDPENEFRRDPQFYEAFKHALIGVLLTALFLIAWFGWGAFNGTGPR